MTGTTVSGAVTVLVRTLQDPVTGATIPEVPVSTRSVWDQHLETRAFPPKFSLNTINYDAAADILLPRAVGYSAGLLDYFFRGRLEAFLEAPVDPTLGVFALRIVNRTPGERMGGMFTLYEETADGSRQVVLSWMLNLAPGETSGSLVVPTFGVGPPFLLVFRGDLGAEARMAVAATWVDGLFALFLADFSGLGEFTLVGQYPTPAVPGIFLAHGRFPDGEEYLQFVCRSLTAVPSSLLINVRGPDESPITSLAPGTREASFVEFAAAASIPEMFGWRLRTNPPAVRQVIRPLTAQDFDIPDPPFVQNSALDVTGVRCWGARLDVPIGEVRAGGALVRE